MENFAKSRCTRILCEYASARDFPARNSVLNVSEFYCNMEYSTAGKRTASFDLHRSIDDRPTVNAAMKTGALLCNVQDSPLRSLDS